jgi:hypothetical protein
MEIDLLLKHLAAGINVSTAILLVAVYNGIRVSRIERTVSSLIAHVQQCPKTRKHPVTIPTALLLAFLAACLLSGCQQVPGGLSIRLGFDFPPSTNPPPSTLTTNAP